MEKKLSKHPEAFGKGAIEGVAGPGGGQQRRPAGALVPLLTLGIPLNAVTASAGRLHITGSSPGRC